MRKKGGGARKHALIDITVEPSADVRFPITGEITRRAKPYAGKSGLEIAGSDD